MQEMFVWLLGSMHTGYTEQVIGCLDACISPLYHVHPMCSHPHCANQALGKRQIFSHHGSLAGGWLLHHQSLTQTLVQVSKQAALHLESLAHRYTGKQTRPRYGDR